MTDRIKIEQSPNIIRCWMETPEFGTLCNGIEITMRINGRDKDELISYMKGEIEKKYSKTKQVYEATDKTTL